MEKDFESWIRQWQPDGQFPSARSPKLPFDVGMQNRVPPAVHCADAIPSNCQSPTFGFLGVPNFERAQLDKPHGWLRCRQGVIPALVPSEKLLPKTNAPGKVRVFANENCGEINSPIATDNARAPKQFVVFDQSGDKTTMIFSSGIGTAIQLLGSLRPKATGNCCNVNGNEIGVGSSGKNQAEPNLTNKLDEGQGIDLGSEIHEDTEEINALLYSDDEDNYSEDGEETSTGHSPSTMTAYETQDWFEEDDIGEVASSAGPAKRQKLSDGNYEVASAPKTASSVKLNRSLEDEDDAESCCGGGELPLRNGNVGSLSGNKRARKEKICKTISILQSIIPGGQGKDAVKVLDEAINYLRTLRFKAESLGLSAF